MLRTFISVSALLIACTLSWLACGGEDDDGGSTGPSSTGSLEVTLVMTGENLDEDGCEFSVNAGAVRTLLAGQSTTFSGLLPGSHVVQIGGVAPNCQVQGNQLREATVTAGQTTAVAFAVTCSSTLGAIEITGLDQVDEAGDRGEVGLG